VRGHRQPERAAPALPGDGRTLRPHRRGLRFAFRGIRIDEVEPGDGVPGNEEALTVGPPPEQRRAAAGADEPGPDAR
jgi:hypothetical protein